VELEPALALVVDRDARDIGREQVGRELDARVRAVERVREGLREHRLARAREVLEEDMPLGEHRDEHELDDLALAEDRLVDVVDELAEGVLEPQGLFGCHGHGVRPFLIDSWALKGVSRHITSCCSAPRR
jgi:hypothetical protein